MCSTSIFLFLFLMIRPLPRSTLFPYTTLFRSVSARSVGEVAYRCPVVDIVDRVGRRRERTERRAVVLEHHRDRVRQRRSEEHTSELQSRRDLVCRLLLEKKKSITVSWVLRGVC